VDNDADGDTDCADVDCSSESYCEATEVTCDDSFDNDGDGQVDCADADCSGLAVCTVGTGDPCLVDADCTMPGAFCLMEHGYGFPSGYCTVDCSATSTCSEADAVCVDAGILICVQECTLANPVECRAGYSCDDIGHAAGMGLCWPDCLSNTECPETNECDTTSGFCVWGEVEAANEAVTNDNDADGIADAAETFDLAFDAENVGGGVAAGPISVTVSVNSGASTVTGTVTVTAPADTQCSASDMAAGTVSACQPWTVQIPVSAQAGERVAFDFEFTNGTDTWAETWSLSIGTLYQSLIPTLDPQGDNGAFACDLSDVQGYVAGGTMYLRMDFHASCTPAGTMGLYLCDSNLDCLLLSLQDDGFGTMEEVIYSSLQNWNPITTVPASYQVTPTTGTTQTLSFQIAIADIPDIDTTAGRLDVAAAVAGLNAADWEDLAPDSGFGEIRW
jgi:hypothetical protein